MKIHRFIGAFNLTPAFLEIHEPELVHQIKNVLHLSIGEQIVLCDGQGAEATGEIMSFDKGALQIKILEQHKNQTEPAHQAILYCALLKRENFEWVVQKATEVGVTEIVPVISARTVKLKINRKRSQLITREAAEQSGRGMVPMIHEPMKFEQALIQAKQSGMTYFFDSIRAGDQAWGVTPGQDPRDYVRLFIGPEGGWTEEEVMAAKKAGCQMMSLGPLTFRAETAAIIATYLATCATLFVPPKR